MFKVNDYVMYGTTGVCQIDEIKKETFIGDEELAYYVLHTLYGNPSTIMTPVHNQKVSMRSIITKEEALALIEEIHSKEPVWLNDDRKRNENFTVALKTGNSETWIQILKSLYHKKKEMAATGKKLSVSDANILKSTERLLYEEFSTALNIPIKEVEAYILNHIG